MKKLALISSLLFMTSCVTPNRAGEEILVQPSMKPANELYDWEFTIWQDRYIAFRAVNRETGEASPWMYEEIVIILGENREEDSHRYTILPATAE